MNWILYTYSRLFVKKIKRQSSKIPKSDFVTAVDSGAAAILCPTSRTTIRRHIFKRPPRALLAVEAGRKFHYAKLLRKKSTQKKGMLSKLSDLPFAKKGNLKSLKKLYKKHFYSLVWKKNFARRWTNKYRYRPICISLLKKNHNCKKGYFLSNNATFFYPFLLTALYLAGTWLKFTLFKISPIRVPDISVDYKRIKI